MADFKIEKDMNIVKLLTAQAKGERVDSGKAEEFSAQIQTMLSDFNPQNRYMIAQLIGFGVDALTREAPSLAAQIADFKVVGLDDKARFNVPQGRIKAIVHAKGATVPRSRVADKSIILDTVAVSARPSLSVIEVRSGRKNMADLIRSAHYEMALEKNAYIQTVLANAITSYSSPFYATGAGVVQATFDPQLTHFRRLGQTVLIGDHAVMDKVALLTGFVPAGGTDAQFADDIMAQYHINGFIGSYRSARVLPLQNGYKADGVTPILDPAYIYIMPVAGSTDERSLKVVEEGPVMAHEETNIDDLSYDVRLDQFFGAAFIVGNVPNLGVYEDSTL